MSKKLIATVVLLNEKNKILMEKNNNCNNYKCCWQFPGGKVEKGELLKIAAIRELKEELNITVKEEDLVSLTFNNYLKFNKSYIVFYYFCKKWEGEISNNEGQTIEWFDISNVSKDNILPYSYNVISCLLNFLKSN